MERSKELSHKFNNNNPIIAIFMSVCPPPYVGGAEQSSIDYANYLAENNFNVVIYSLIKKKENCVKQELKKNLISIRIPTTLKYHPLLEKKERKNSVKILWHMQNLMQRQNTRSLLLAFKEMHPHAILCHNLPGWGVLPWNLSKKLGVPLVQMCHDYALVCFRSTLWTSKRGECNGRCLRCFPRRNITRYWKKYLNFIFVSKYVEKQITQAIEISDSTKKIVINPPISIPYGIKLKSGNQIDFGYIGRITKEKGIVEILKSCKRLQKGILIAGEGDIEFIKELKNDFPDAKFVGTMNKWDFYNSVRVVCVLSLWPEPLARTAIEATILGKPLILSKKGGLTEISTMKNHKAYFVDPISEYELDTAMIQALNNKEEQVIDPSNKDLQYCGNQLVKFLELVAKEK